MACTGGYECIMRNACIGGLGNTSSLPIVMINVVFQTTPFWALGVYGRILKAPIPQYTAVYSGVYGRILRVYGRILGVFVCTTWVFQVEKFHCCAFCAHLVACFVKVLPWVVDGAGGLGAGKTSGAGTRGVDLNPAVGGRTGDTDTNGGESSNNGSKIHVECFPAENPSL